MAEIHDEKGVSQSLFTWLSLRTEMSTVVNPPLIPMRAESVLTLFILENPVELKDACVTGPLDLRSIGVRGPVRISNCVFEDAVDATDARFGRSVQFTDCIFEKGLSLAHARIAGPFDLSGSVLKPMAGATAMPLHDLHVEGSVQGTRLQVECGLNFSDLRCGSAFRLHGASIAGELLLNSAYVEGELDLSDCASPDGVPAAQTIIRGVLNCDCAHIESRVLLIGTHLGSAKFEQAHIEGTMLLGPGLHSQTQVELGVVAEAGKPSDGCSLSLLGARLDGSLEIRGAKLHGALRVSNAKVGCNMMLSGDAPKKPRFQTSIGASEGGGSLRVTSADVRGALVLLNVTFDGLVEISNSEVAVLEIDEKCILNLKTLFEGLPDNKKREGVLALEGLTFGELNLGEPDDPKKEPRAQDFLQLLALTKFDEGTYVNIESWLRLSARDEDADDVFREMRKKETAQRREGLKRVLFKLFGWLYGYGTQIRTACYIWLGTFSLSLSLLMLDGSGLDATEKDDQPAAIRAVVKKEPGLADKAAVVFRIHLPIVPWFSDPEWKPAARSIPKPAWFLQCVPWPPLRYDAIAYSLLVWNVVNVTLIIASISGLLKRRGS